MSQEGQPPRIAFTVTSGRVQHYNDVVEHMLQQQVSKYVQQHKKNPSKQQVDFLRKELVRYMVIRKDLDTASKLQLSASDILLEKTG